MRVLVCGGRDFGNLASLVAQGIRKGPAYDKAKKEYEFIMRKLNELSLEWPKTPPDRYGNFLPAVTIISGKASGADSVAIDWAVVNWCRFLEFEADWKTYGKAAGPIRNQRMLAEGKPDLVVAFPGGPGTRNMKQLARAANIKVIEVDYGNECQDRKDDQLRPNVEG